MDKIRFGMIGAGNISSLHVPAMQGLAGAECVCIADANLDQAKSRAEAWDIPRAVDSYDELIAMDDIDAVVIGIPTRFHSDAAIKAAKAGKHCLCEKPMARTLEECQSMIDAHAEAGTTLGIAFVRRYDQNWGQIRKMVQESKVGRPCMWRRIVAGAAPGPPNYGVWYFDSKFSDGPLTESGSHDLDFLRYTFGDVASVTGYASHDANYGSVLDNTIAIFEFESGDKALVQWSWSLPIGASSGFSGMDVIGPEGCIREPRQEDEQWVIDISKAAGEMETVPFDNVRDNTTWGFGQIAGFMDAIREGHDPRASGMDGYKAQEMFLAVVKSWETGQRIELPL